MQLRQEIETSAQKIEALVAENSTMQDVTQKDIDRVKARFDRIFAENEELKK